MLEQLRSQKLLTVVSVAGTALSILLIMAVVMIQEVKVLPFARRATATGFCI